MFLRTVDQNRKRDLEMRLAEADAEIRELQASRDEQFAKDQALRADFETLKAARVSGVATLLRMFRLTVDHNSGRSRQ